MCVFPTIATCLLPAGVPVPFSLVLFPFLVLSFYDVPFLFFPFLLCLCPLIYICCSIHGHSMCFSSTIATCLCHAGEPGSPFLAVSSLSLAPSCYKFYVLFFSNWRIFPVYVSRGKTAFLVLARLVRQGVYNYGHNIHINNAYWLTETYLFGLYNRWLKPIYVYIINLLFAPHFFVVRHSISSTAQGSGGSFRNRKPIGEAGCCESGMAERSH